MKKKSTLRIVTFYIKKFLITFFLYALLVDTSEAQVIPLPITKSTNSILLGSIQFCHSVTREIEFQILYKGSQYPAKVDINGDTRKAHFELYEEDELTEIFILITDYFARPDNPMVLHLFTSPDHEFRLFKLTKIKLKNGDNKEVYDTWQVDELNDTKKSIIIPDNTIVIFLNSSIVEKIQPMSWLSQSNIIYLPIIKLKESVSKDMLYKITDQMKLTLLDFKFLHTTANLASIPHANNRLLSMPFAPRRTQA